MSSLTATYTGNTYDMLNDSFGLIDKSPNRWRNLITQINMLNANSDGLTAYKLFYVARHGEGYHNVGEAKYGTAEWDCVRGLIVQILLDSD